MPLIRALNLVNAIMRDPTFMNNSVFIYSYQIRSSKGLNQPLQPTKNKPWAIYVIPLLVLCLCSRLSVPANAGTVLQVGDVIAADNTLVGGSGSLIRIDPQTGAQTVFTQGQFSFVLGITFDGRGDIIVADNVSGVFRVDRDTGETVQLSQMKGTTDVAVERSGNLVVTVEAASGGGVWRINPGTGQANLVSSGGHLVEQFGTTVAGDGSIFVADWRAHKVIRIDSSIADDGHGGNQTVVSSGGHLAGQIPIVGQPADIAFARDGSLLATANDGIIQIDPSIPDDGQGGNQTLVSPGTSWSRLAMGENETAFTTQLALIISGSPIWRVDLQTGEAVQLTPFGPFWGVAAVPRLADTDGDGVPDRFDQCSSTQAGNAVDAHGCSISQLVPCEGPAGGGTWGNHGSYVAELIRVASQFLQQGVITRQQMIEILKKGSQSDCGKVAKQ